MTISMAIALTKTMQRSHMQIKISQQFKRQMKNMKNMKKMKKMKDTTLGQKRAIIRKS